MTKIVSILPVQCIEQSMVRQPIEFYLTHIVLKYAKSFNKVRCGNFFKILDCSACELGRGVSMNDILKAADIIKASEIVLPDIARSDRSLNTSLKALAKLGAKYVDAYSIAIVIQGTTLEKAKKSLSRLMGDPLAIYIDTIMIPKWFTTDERIELTQYIQNHCKQRGALDQFNIHWLGLGDDIDRCICAARELNIRSMDTGYFISVAQKGMHNVIKAKRDKKQKIDLVHNTLSTEQVYDVISITNYYDFAPSRIAKYEDVLVWAKYIATIAIVVMTVALLCAIFVK